MDKNSLTGAILIVLIWIVFSTFFLNSGNENKQEIDRTQLNVEQRTTNDVDSENQNYINNKLEIEEQSIFKNLRTGEDGFEVLENEKIKLWVNRKGGGIESVFINDYKTYILYMCTKVDVHNSLKNKWHKLQLLNKTYILY